MFKWGRRLNRLFCKSGVSGLIPSRTLNLIWLFSVFLTVCFGSGVKLTTCKTNIMLKC